MNARKTIKSFVIGCGLFLLGAVHADTLTVTSGQTVTIDSAQTYDAVSLSGGTIVLSAGGVLTTAGGVSANTADSTICFAGGRLKTARQVLASGTTLTLVAEGGDVNVDFDCSAWIYGFATANSGKIVTSGTGKFVITLLQQSIGLGSDGLSLEQGQSGRMEVLGKTELAVNKDVFNAHEVYIAGDASINIGGTWITVGSLTGPGRVSGQAGGRVTISVGEGKVGSCLSHVDPSLSLVKSGSGVLLALGAVTPPFTVNGGEICAVTRGSIGYSRFRFKVDGVGTPTKTGMHLNELALMVEDVNISSGYSAYDMGAGYGGQSILDGKDSTKWWYDYDNQSAPSFDKAWVEVRFADRHILTGYRLKSSDWGGDVPKSWRLYGCDAGGDWELIDQKTDEPTAPTPENKWSPLYAVGCAQMPGTLSCPALTIAASTVLNAPMGTTFEAGLAVDGTACLAGTGAFAKTGTGALLSDSATELSAVTVCEGSLAFRTPISWKQWKLAIGDVYNLEGAEVTFGELAVYDADGNRLNVIGLPTFSSYTGGSFSDGQAKLLYDGQDNGQGWISSSGLNPSDEKTWKWTAFTLSETAPAVSGYNLRTATYLAAGSPKTWKLYARANEQDEWTLIDSQSNVTVPGSYSWYNGGKPWRVSSDAASGAAFPAETSVSVASGATLDLTQAAQTTLSQIVVDGDGEGVGVIRRGICADVGTLAVTYAGAVPKGSFSLPLKFEDVANADALANWTVTINGKVSRKKLAVDGDGQLGLTAPGMLLLFR